MVDLSEEYSLLKEYLKHGVATTLVAYAVNAPFNAWVTRSKKLSREDKRRLIGAGIGASGGGGLGYLAGEKVCREEYSARQKAMSVAIGVLTGAAGGYLISHATQKVKK